MAPQGTSKKLRHAFKSRKQRAKELRSLRDGQGIGKAGAEQLEARYLLEERCRLRLKATQAPQGLTAHVLQAIPKIRR